MVQLADRLTRQKKLNPTAQHQQIILCAQPAFPFWNNALIYSRVAISAVQRKADGSGRYGNRLLEAQSQEWEKEHKLWNTHKKLNLNKTYGQLCSFWTSEGSHTNIKWDWRTRPAFVLSLSWRPAQSKISWEAWAGGCITGRLFIVTATSRTFVRSQRAADDTHCRAPLGVYQTEICQQLSLHNNENVVVLIYDFCFKKFTQLSFY